MDKQPGLKESEAGFSLAELIVAMGIFTVFLAIFMAGIIGLTRGTSRTQVASETTSAVVNVFETLDRQVRYADYINAPGVGPSGYRYIEFRTPAPSSAAVPPVTTCTQWRYSPTAGTIQMRTWPDSAGAVPSAWSTKLRSVITKSAVTYPFNVESATVVGATKQLFVLDIDAGDADIGAGTAVTTKFVARNSSYDLQTSITTPVCLATGSRP